MKRVAIMAVALTLAFCAVAVAGNNPAVKVAVHVRGHNAKAGCHPGRIIQDCADIITTEGMASVDAFPVFFDITEFMGCEYGLCWPAWYYPATFTSCSDVVIGDIEWPGDGASHAWSECQTEVCIPSYIWVYGYWPGMICPCPHPASGEIHIVDCEEGIDHPACVFCAGVSGLTGDDPCWPTNTETDTWSDIKRMFE